MSVSRYERPQFEIVAERNGYEIRRYDSYLVAETVVSGGFDEAGSAAFRRLAGFIFGNNSQQLKMNMTVPVTRQSVDQSAQRYRFVMERAYARDELPAPNDERVAIAEVPAGYFAARGFRGNRTERRYRQMAAQLLDSLQCESIEIIGPPESAVYSGPLTPPVFRYNEVLVPIEWS